MASFGLVAGGLPTIVSLKEIMKDHRIAVQQGLATSMTQARIKAAEHLIPNTTGFVNPYRARKKQPSTPGRLTSRTNKLHYMLMNRASLSNPLGHWIGFGNKLAKERSVSLMGQIRATDITSKTESYIATYKVNILGDSHLWDTHRGKPRESIRTLVMRYMWEYRDRPIFKPIISLVDFNTRKQVELKNNRIWGKTI
jgi:hypothetical protein